MVSNSSYVSTTIVPITINELTNSVTTDTSTWTVSGSGFFDILMTTATKHLLAQFEANRIRQEDYASAYVEVYKETLKVAVDAWLRKDLVATQIAGEKAKINLTIAQTDKEEKETEKLTYEVTYLMPAQKANIEATTAKLVAEKEKTESETTNLIPAQKNLLIAQTSKENAQTTNITQQTAESVEKEKLLRRQREGFDEEYKYKVLKACLDSWAVAFSVAKDDTNFNSVPNAIGTSALNSLWTNVLSDIDTNRTYTYS